MTGQLFVLCGQLPQAADILGLEHLLGHGRVDEVAQRGGVRLLQREVEVLPEVVEEAADLRVVDDADHRHALPGGKDQRVQPHGDDERHPADEKRILRALEVYLETGETITEHNRKTQAVPPRYSPIWLGLDFAQRGELYRRIDLRVSLMLQQGLVEEIQGLLADGIPETATAMQAIGYKEFVDALDGRCTIEEAADLVRQSSRRYAKRQLTWFRRNKAIHWLIREAGDTGREILENARRIVSDFDN